MKGLVLMAGGVLAMALGATSASAAPISGLKPVGKSADSALVQVHGQHMSCERGRWGWHRSPRWGSRIECRPRWDRGHDHGRNFDGPPPRHVPDMAPPRRPLPRY